MRRTTVSPSTEPTQEEMSGHVLAIIGAYRMGGVVEARKLYPRRVSKAGPESTPRPAEGYIRNGVYHVAETASSRRN